MKLRDEYAKFATQETIEKLFEEGSKEAKKAGDELRKMREDAEEFEKDVAKQKQKNWDKEKERLDKQFQKAREQQRDVRDRQLARIDEKATNRTSSLLDAIGNPSFTSGQSFTAGGKGEYEFLANMERAKTGQSAEEKAWQKAEEQRNDLIAAFNALQRDLNDKMNDAIRALGPRPEVIE
jgi:hypothetical protein